MHPYHLELSLTRAPSLPLESFRWTTAALAVNMVNVPADIADEFRQVFTNLEGVLSAVGSTNYVAEDFRSVYPIFERR